MVPFSWMSPSLLNAMWIVNVGLMFHEAYRLIVSMKFSSNWEQLVVYYPRFFLMMVVGIGCCLSLSLSLSIMKGKIDGCSTNKTSQKEIRK